MKLFSDSILTYIVVGFLIIKVFDLWSQDNFCNSRQPISHKAYIKEKEWC